MLNAPNQIFNLLFGSLNSAFIFLFWRGFFYINESKKINYFKK